VPVCIFLFSLAPEADIVAVPPEIMPYERARHYHRSGNDSHPHRGAYRISGIRIRRNAYANADPDSGVCLMRGHGQHAQQGNYGKSDFLKHLFHPPLHSTLHAE
jgi:hypothetical protein